LLRWRLPEEGRGVSKLQNYFTEELAGHYDLWDFSKDVDKIGKYLITTDKGLFGSSTLNIPYRDFQPAKRLHLISRSLYQWVEDSKSKDWIAYNNYVEILTPDKPLMDIERHDIDTINVTVGFSDNERDTQLTEDDACIISTETAKRFKFKFVIPQKFVMDKKPAPEFPVELGCRVMPVTGRDYIDDYSSPRATGTFIMKKTREVKVDNEPDSVGIYDIEGYITGERDAQIGDKITGLTGLKTVICEVRDNMDSDIIIHPKEIWGAKASSKRGGMVKELQQHGVIMVGLRKDTLPEYQASYTGGMRVSKTVYPVMKLYAEGTLKQIVDNNSRFDEVLKLLHLKYMDGRFMLLPENEIDTDNDSWVQYPHVMYEGEVCKHETESFPVFKDTVTRYFSPEDITQLKVYDTWTREGKREREYMKEEAYEAVETTESIYKIAWSYCYNPTFFAPYFINSRGNLRHVQLFLKDEYDENGKLIQQGNYNKTWDEMKDKSNVLFPWATKPQKTGKQRKEGTETSSAVKDVILKQAFLPIRDGLYLVVVPQIDLAANIVELNLKEQPDFGKKVHGKRYGLIVREPVVSKRGIVCVEIRNNPKIPKGVIRVAPVLIRGMNGDYDGDRVSILPYYAKGLLPSNEDIKTVKTEIVGFDLDSIKPIQRTKDELIDEAMAYQTNYIYNQRLVAKYGGLKNDAAMSNDSNKVEEAILSLAENLELLLADVAETKEQKDINIVKIKKAGKALDNLIDKDIPADGDIKRLKDKADVQLFYSVKGVKMIDLKQITSYEGYNTVTTTYRDIPTAKHERLLWFKPLKYLELLFKVESKPENSIKVKEHPKATDEVKEHSKVNDKVKEGVITLTDENFDSVLDKNKYVVVMWTGEHCGVCQTDKPRFKGLSRSYKGKVVFGVVDTGDFEGCKELRKGIQHIPQYRLYTNTKETENLLTVPSKVALDAALKGESVYDAVMKDYKTIMGGNER
jgi:thioredoxin 1